MPIFIIPPKQGKSYRFQYAVTGNKIRLTVESTHLVDIYLVDTSKYEKLSSDFKKYDDLGAVVFLGSKGFENQLVNLPQGLSPGWHLFFGSSSDEEVAVFFDVHVERE